MPRTMRIRSASWPLRALSLLTFVSLVVAPACAPLCAAHNCLPAETSAATSGNCHGGGMPDKAPRMHSFSGCASPELPAVVLTRTPLQEASDIHRLSAPDGKFVAAERENPAPAAPFSNSYFGPPHEFAAGFAPLSSTVLRI